MTSSSAYTSVTTLFHDASVTLHQGRRRQDGANVIIKAPSPEAPSAREVERLRHEYEMTRRVESSYWLRALELEMLDGRPQLILEGFDGAPMSERMTQPMQVDEFLEVAAELAAGLSDLHAQGVVHLNLKPANVLLERSGRRVKLTDLSLAAPLDQTSSTAPRAALLEGTLAYMSPEQTGRVNRAADHRSDLYSLGVTFYQMLTGALPFRAKQPLEWVHCHVARQARSPRELSPSIPEPIAAIVMKLLSKLPEARYQSARGLEVDLRRCLERRRSGDELESFELGSDDALDQFVIPRKLYGREEPLGRLRAALEGVTRTGVSTLVSVRGPSGVGKSALVRELYEPTLQGGGRFISGKFVQNEPGVPFLTFSRALGELVEQAMASAELAGLRDVLRAALGPDARLAVDLVPSLEAVIGAAPPLSESSPSEAQHRLVHVLQRLIGVFAVPGHPLVLFLDDAQWADPASLRLLAALLSSPDLRHLLAVIAYREEEVSGEHPLPQTLEALRRRAIPIVEVTVAPLSRADVGLWVAETVLQPVSQAAPLADVVYARAGGNPFFTIQLLDVLHQRGVLASFSRGGGWQWSVPELEQRAPTEDAAELMASRLHGLPPATQAMLSLTASLGTAADTAILATLARCSEDEVCRALAPAVDAGLLWQMGAGYAFPHDRVLEAAYALMLDAARAARHLEIGRLLLAHTPENELPDRVYLIATHLGRGAHLMVSRAERERLAELNLLAGRRAKAAVAFDSALVFFTAGTELLADDAWVRRRDLTFALELERAECEFLTGQLERAEARLAELATKTVDLIEASAIARERIDVSTALNQNTRAIELGLEYLRGVGIDWAPHPTEGEAQREYEQLLARLGDRAVEGLIDLPRAPPKAQATIDVLALLLPAALYSDPNLFALVAARIAGLSLEHGNSDSSCLGYVWLNANLISRFGNYDLGYRFAQLACDLVERRGLVRYETRVFQAFGFAVSPWTHHLAERRALVWRSLATAQRTGDVAFATYAWNLTVALRLAAGDPLPELLGLTEDGLEYTRKTGLLFVADNFIGQRAFIRSMMGLTRQVGCFDDDGFDEGRFEAYLDESPHRAIAALWYWLRKLQARSFTLDAAAALEAGARAERFLFTQASIIEGAELHLHRGLAAAWLADTAPTEARLGHLETLRSDHAKLAAMAKHAPMNVDHRVALLAAEWARLEGRDLDAMRAFDQALSAARHNGFAHHEGLAAESAARFYAERGFADIALAYARRARASYRRWGAAGVVRRIDGRYPGLTEAVPVGSTVTLAAPAEQLDLSSIVEASQAISRETRLPELQETLMRLVLEHGGAERGALLLAGSGEALLVHARAEVAGDATRVELVPGVPPAGEGLPISVIQAAQRNGEPVVLADALSSRFAGDPYLVATRARSVLALPIRRQAQVVGVLYLENRLVADVFGGRAREVLGLLATQAAISLQTAQAYAALSEENAVRREAEERFRRLNEELEKRVQRRTAELEKANRELDAFAHSVSHDLRAPLRHIEGFATLLEKRAPEGLDEKSRGYLRSIVGSAERMAQLIDDLLSFSRLLRTERVMGPVDLSELVQEVISELESEARGREIRWHVGELPTVMGDRAMLRVVFMNLLSNALKYTRLRARADIEVACDSTETADGTVLHVRDNGAGFDQRYADRLFQVFQRLHGPETFEGTGVGLATVRRVVEAHGGRTWAEGVVDKGATFFFSLPRRAP